MYIVVPHMNYFNVYCYILYELFVLMYIVVSHMNCFF